jgi:membrane protease subunit (stomatin/prohibitin family)
MGLKDVIKNQLRAVIQWEDPQPWQIFHRFTNRGDELKNASKLIIQPGQGCIFTHKGKIEGVFQEEGTYNLKTDNKPFITTIKKLMNAFESEHKVGLWFFKNNEMTNIRWGTRIPITYNDPVYSFPVNLRGFGNYSIKIANPKAFFTNIVGGMKNYYCAELQELFLSRITQPISNYLANAKFSYAEIDANIENIAKDAQEKTDAIFKDLGFELLDFRIEGTSFDDETNKRISGISDIHAEVQAAKLAGIDYVELQKLKALKDAAKNEGAVGASMGLLAGMNFGNSINQTQQSQPASTPTEEPPMEKLKKLKELFEMELITEEEYTQKKQSILDTM